MSNLKKWAMRDGQKVRIKDMTDSHLVNTIRMLGRKHDDEKEAAWSVLSTLQGEMAQMYCENDISRMEDNGPAATSPIYEDMMEEATRRGLKP